VKAHEWPILESILLACVLISCGPTKKGYESAIRNGNEQILRTNLSNIRGIIRQYAIDNGAPPEALSDLVEAGYINEIPPDPMTNKTDWTVVRNHCPALTKCKEGIVDIHSASPAKSLKGDSYSDW
jgi:general secretion pathway protein G